MQVRAAYIERLKDKGHTRNYETEFRFQGVLAPYLLSSVVVEIEGDLYALNVARDATSIRENQRALREAQELLHAQVEELTATEELSSALQQSNEQSNRDIRVLYSGDGGTCEPAWACRVDILSDEKLASQLTDYPYPFFAFWSDSKGKQRIKWTTRKRPTPFIHLDDPSIPYYPQIKRSLKRQVESQTIPTQGIGSQYSPTTGQNITTFWKVSPDRKDAKGQGSAEYVEARYTAGLVTQPISVYGAVLPGGYQFAILSPDGLVVYHSDTTRNLRENFFAEAGQNSDLRSRVRMRSEGPVTATYIGRPHRMYVVPMSAGNQDGPWTIVIFRDLHLEEVLNLEILSLVTILFVLYVAAVILIMVAVHLLHKGNAARWFWPDSRKAGAYRWLALVNGVTALMLLILFQMPAFLALLFCGILIPAGAIAFNLALLRRHDDKASPKDVENKTTSDRWQLYFAGACATLISTACSSIRQSRSCD
jgi:hypothetical protein